MAAKRNGIKTVIIPKQNQRDLSEIDPVVRESLRFVVADTIDTVLSEALCCPMPAEEKRESDMVCDFLPVQGTVKEVGLRQ